MSIKGSPAKPDASAVDRISDEEDQQQRGIIGSQHKGGDRPDEPGHDAHGRRPPIERHLQRLALQAMRDEQLRQEPAGVPHRPDQADQEVGAAQLLHEPRQHRIDRHQRFGKNEQSAVDDAQRKVASQMRIRFKSLVSCVASATMHLVKSARLVRNRPGQAAADYNTDLVLKEPLRQSVIYDIIPNKFTCKRLADH